MLLNHYLPNYHFNDAHDITVRASPGQVLRSVEELTPQELSPLFHLLFAIRSLPEQLFGKKGMAFTKTKPLFQQMLAKNFVLLAKEPDRELVFGMLVPGQIGRFWKRSVEIASPPTCAQAFIEFDDPNHVKVVANFWVEGEGDGGVRVSTESRMQALSPSARQSFATYWRLIYPGSALIRKVWLRAIKKRAERGKA